jgi:hypothetical protein
MADGKPQRIVLYSEAALAAWNNGREAWNAYVAANPEEELEQIGSGGGYPALYGDAAMSLWRQGMEAWNAWVADNPRADVDFCDEYFEANCKIPNGSWFVNFSGFVFPEGYVDFYGSTFSNGGVSFESIIFGEGDVSFTNATFGEGDVNFNDATFGYGDVNFTGVTFGDGNVFFSDAKLDKGDVDFSDASFGRGAVVVRNLAFEGIARFDRLKKLEHCTRFSFEGCSFDKLFTFSHEGQMGCPLDLRRTKLTHGVVLNDLKCDYVEVPVLAWPARLCHWFFAYPDGEPPAWQLLKRAADPEDSQRFRRLKELALSENNRAKALEFNAQELRSQRGHETGWLQDFLQFFYMLLSDYGRSVVRPLVAVGVVTGVFGALYAQLSTKLSFGAALPAGITYSGGNMFAFVPIGRSALEQSRMELFSDRVPYELLWIGGFQSVLSVILLFLLGLGLRNMFRL